MNSMIWDRLPQLMYYFSRPLILSLGLQEWDIRRHSPSSNSLGIDRPMSSMSGLISGLLVSYFVLH